MKAIAGKEIRVIEPTSDFRKMVEKELTVANPEYARKQKMGKWVGGTPSTIKFYRTEGKDIVLPFGCLRGWIFDQKEQFEEAIADFPQTQYVEYNKDVPLYGYQEKAVDKALYKRNGILVAPCGSGKTQMGIAIARSISRPTLWITHTRDLMVQAEERAKGIFDLPKEAYGEITEGKVNVGTHLTFSTVQTLAKVNLDNLKFGCVIVDECHHAVQSYKATSMFAKVMNQISCRYKFGLTATPYRADGLEKGMFALIGDICSVVDEEEVKGKTVPVYEEWYTVPPYTSYVDCYNGDGTLDYTKLITKLCNDVGRNLFIGRKIVDIKGSCLVLSDRLSQLETLMKYVSHYKKCDMVKATNTKQGKKERREAIEKLKDGRIDCLFATYKLAKEGLDIPSLENVVMASPIKDKSTVIQTAGRVARKVEGKSCGWVHDFMDGLGVLQGMAKKRKNIRKHLNN